MILRTGSLNEMGYAARLISGIELKYAIKTSNYEKVGDALILR